MWNLDTHLAPRDGTRGSIVTVAAPQTPGLENIEATIGCRERNMLEHMDFSFASQGQFS